MRANLTCTYCGNHLNLRWEMTAPQQWELICQSCLPQPAIPLFTWSLDNAMDWLKAQDIKAWKQVRQIYDSLKDLETQEEHRRQRGISHRRLSLVRVLANQGQLALRGTSG